MGGSKQFTPEKEFRPLGQPSSKPILKPGDGISGVGDPITFLDLSDTISSYLGHAGKFLMVSLTKTGVTVSPILVESDKNYVHAQVIPSDVWQVNHQLGKKPSVQLFDDSGNPFDAFCRHIDGVGSDSDNDTRIDIDESITGIAVFN